MLEICNLYLSSLHLSLLLGLQRNSQKIRHIFSEKTYEIKRIWQKLAGSIGLSKSNLRIANTEVISEIGLNPSDQSVSCTIFDGEYLAL